MRALLAIALLSCGSAGASCSLGPGPQQTYLAEWDKWMVNCEADGGTPTQWPGAGRWTCEPCHPDGIGGCRHAP